MLDMKEMFFSSPFTANIRPTARYSHSCATNLISGSEEMEAIVLGGLDF